MAQDADALFEQDVKGVDFPRRDRERASGMLGVVGIGYDAVRENEIGPGLLQEIEVAGKGGGKPVVRVQHLDIGAAGFGQPPVDAGAVMPIGLVDDPEGIRETRLKRVTYFGRPVRRSIVDDERLEKTHAPFIHEQGREASFQICLHVIGRDDEGQNLVHRAGEAVIRSL